jgi:hypothetical protein
MAGCVGLLGFLRQPNLRGCMDNIARGILPADWGGEVEVDESVCWGERL